MFDKRCIAIIPARGGSKTIPKKNIIDFCGKPLIAWTIEQALGSKYVREVYVTTDDKDIGAISSEYGAKVIWRPPHLATDSASSEAALLHAINEIEKHNRIDVVIFLQATSPVRESVDIDKAIESFFSKNADSLFSCTKIRDHFIWDKDKANYTSISYDYNTRKPRQDIKPRYLENGSFYIFRSEAIKKRRNRLGGKIVIYQMPFWKSFQIDDRDDIEICEYYMRRRIITKGAHYAGCAQADI